MVQCGNPCGNRDRLRLLKTERCSNAPGKRGFDMKTKSVRSGKHGVSGEGEVLVYFRFLFAVRILARRVVFVNVIKIAVILQYVEKLQRKIFAKTAC